MLAHLQSPKSLGAHPIVAAGFLLTNQSLTPNWLTINRTFNQSIRCIKFKYSPNLCSVYTYKVFAPAGHKEMNIEIVTLNWNSLFKKYEDHKTISLKPKLIHRTKLQKFKPNKLFEFFSLKLVKYSPCDHTYILKQIFFVWLL